jgi:hypothetical protein
MDHIEIKSLKELGDELKRLDIIAKNENSTSGISSGSQTRCPDQWFSAFNLILIDLPNGKN